MHRCLSIMQYIQKSLLSIIKIIVSIVKSFFNSLKGCSDIRKPVITANASGSAVVTESRSTEEL